ncbi:hypothetical protein OBA47_01405 [bacterium]|nr:hypothetical protein [bacterium]
MHHFLISGQVDFNKPQSSEGLKICYLTQNPSQFNLACLSCIGSRNNYIIFNPDQDLELHVLARTFDFDVTNTRFCFDLNTLKDIVSTFDVVITAFGYLSPALTNELNAVIDLSATYRIPIIDIPHDLFQFGHNLWDDSRIIHLDSPNYGSGGWVDSFCVSQINWFRDHQNGPGYPKFRSIPKNNELCVPDFTLLTTNTDWYLYDSLSQLSLLQFITNYAFKNPAELIVWMPNEKELDHSPAIKNYIDHLLPPNLFVYGSQHHLKFYGLESTDDLIACCQKGITTVSTYLLDFEIHNKDVIVLFNESTKHLVQSFTNVSAIALPSQLHTPISFTKPVTGYLFPYDVSIFDQMILASVPR